jgi:uncharacterized protein YacL
MTEVTGLSLTIVSALILVLGILRLRHVSTPGLAIGLIGAIVGLLLGALASVPLSKLPGSLGSILPLAVSGILTIIMMAVLLSRRAALLALMPFLDGKPRVKTPSTQAEAQSDETGVPLLPQILVDTSVIIDGRIADIATAGFVPGRLVVPRFVLAELQNIADSDDAMRRGRGRRGLDVLNTLRDLPDVDVSIIEDDVVGVREVDAKLVALAQRFKCNVLTTDYNLNRVAQIQGVRVLNVNELSNAIRPVVLPGEELLVRVVQPGKERSQGVGYLADGTMIVVENGDKMMGQEVLTEVTRVFQTVAGKMIFAVPRGNPQPSAHNQHPAPAPRPPETLDQPLETKDTGEAANVRRQRFNRGRGKRPAGDQTQNPHTSIEDRIVSATTPNNPPKN